MVMNAGIVLLVFHSSTAPAVTGWVLEAPWLLFLTWVAYRLVVAYLMENQRRSRIVEQERAVQCR